MAQQYEKIIMIKEAQWKERKSEEQVGMAIFARPAGTRFGPTLMCRVLYGPIRNRVGYRFKKKTRSKSKSGSGFIKKIQDPT